MEAINAVTHTLDSYVQVPLANPYIMAVVKIILSLYAAQLAPKPPAFITELFKNTWVKILALFFIAYISDHDFQLAVLLAVIFVFGSNIFSGRGLFESFAPYSADYTPDNKLTLIESHSDNYPGCEKITMDDLLAAFDNDKLKMQNTVMYAYQQLLQQTTGDAHEKLKKMAYAVGLPYNVDLNKPESAPLIATLLMYAGFSFGKDCTAPN